MKKIILIIFLVSAVPLFGENRILNGLKASRQKAIKIEEEKKEAALKRIKEEYLKKLEELMTKLTQKGDLDAALAVKAEIQTVKQTKY